MIEVLETLFFVSLKGIKEDVLNGKTEILETYVIVFKGNKSLQELAIWAETKKELFLKKYDLNQVLIIDIKYIKN